MTHEQYEKEKAAIMAEYIGEKQSVTNEYAKRTATVESRYREFEEDYRAASRRYSDSINEIKTWFENELAELKKQLLEEEAASCGGNYEIQAIRNRHTERVTELTEKKYEKLDSLDIEWCGAIVKNAISVRDYHINLRHYTLIRRKAMNELKNAMLDKLMELAQRLQEEGGEE